MQSNEKKVNVLAWLDLHTLEIRTDEEKGSDSERMREKNV